MSNERRADGRRVDSRRRLRRRAGLTARICKMALVAAPARLHLDLPGPCGDPREKGRPVPDRQARARPNNSRPLVDLCEKPGDRSGHARQMPRRFGDVGQVHATCARQPQPAARRPVLHGARYLAPTSKGRAAASACSGCTFTTTTRNRFPPKSSRRSAVASLPR